MCCVIFCLNEFYYFTTYNSALAAAARPRTPLGKCASLLQTPSWTREGERDKREEGKGRKRRGGRERERRGEACAPSSAHLPVNGLPVWRPRFLGPQPIIIAKGCKHRDRCFSWCACFPSQLSPIANYTASWQRQRGVRYSLEFFFLFHMAAHWTFVRANASATHCFYVTVRHPCKRWVTLTGEKNKFCLL